jgi:hypothetical protein
MSFTDEIASWRIVKADPRAGCKTTAAFFGGCLRRVLVLRAGSDRGFVWRCWAFQHSWDDPLVNPRTSRWFRDVI